MRKHNAVPQCKREFLLPRWSALWVALIAVGLLCQIQTSCWAHNWGDPGTGPAQFCNINSPTNCDQKGPNPCPPAVGSVNGVPIGSSKNVANNLFMYNCKDAKQNAKKTCCTVWTVCGYHNVYSDGNCGYFLGCHTISKSRCFATATAPATCPAPRKGIDWNNK